MLSAIARHMTSRGTATFVWLARPSHLIAGALRAPRAVKWDGLASQTTAT